MVKKIVIKFSNFIEESNKNMLLLGSTCTGKKTVICECIKKTIIHIMDNYEEYNVYSETRKRKMNN